MICQRVRSDSNGYHAANAYTTTNAAPAMTVISKAGKSVRRKGTDMEMLVGTIFMVGFMVGGLCGVVIAAVVYYIGMRGDDE